jgi:plasmid stabilization system protein ParE
MNPAACARAKKELRLAREAAAEPTRLPDTPEDPYVAYRRHTRPFRRVFRGIITRKEAERFTVARVRRQRTIVQNLQGESA